jgi:hypothetical protein
MSNILELFNFRKIKRKLKKEKEKFADKENDILVKIWDIIGLLSFVFVITILVIENLKNFKVITMNFDYIYKYIVLGVSILYILYTLF